MSALASIHLLGGKRKEREGFMKKTASAKGHDEVRDKWQERWFVLKGHSLDYFKKPEDGAPKGSIDLRAAKIDPGDGKTSKPFCIRIAQAKQVFTYLQCANQDDYEAWLYALRKCAGYKMEDANPKNVAPKTQSEGMGCLPALCKVNVTMNKLDEVAVMLDVSESSLKVWKDGNVVSVQPCSSITNVSRSNRPEERSPFNNEMSLWSVTCDFKNDNYLSRKQFWVGSENEATRLHRMLLDARNGDFHRVQHLQSSAPLLVGQLQVRDSQADPPRWVDRWAVLMEHRAVLFQNAYDTVPMRVIGLADAAVSPDGKLGVEVLGHITRCTFLLQDGDSRARWLSKLQRATVNLQESIDHEVKASESGPLESPHDTAPPPPSFDEFDNEQHSLALASSMEHTAQAVLGALNNPSFVASWGCGTSGQLGHRTKDSNVAPRAVDALRSKRIFRIAAGEEHVVALAAEQGHVFVWGIGAEFQLGLGETRLQTSSPYLVTSLRARIVDIACGRAHTIVLSVANEVFSWGAGTKGQLGHGTLVPSPYPKPINSLASQRVSAVFAGGNSSAVLASGGEQLLLWGCNENAQLGLDHCELTCAPTASPFTSAQSNGGARILSLSLSESSTALLLDSGRLFTTGDNIFGQLGLGDVHQRTVFCEVPFFASRRLQVACVAMGPRHCVAAVKGSGDVYSWGTAVSSGHQNATTEPTRLNALSNVQACATSETHTLLLRDMHRVFSFGSNAYGELGNMQPNVSAVTSVSLCEGCHVVGLACGRGFSVILCRGVPPANLSADKTPLLSEPMGVVSAADGFSQVPMSEAKANEEIAALLGKLNMAQERGQRQAAAAAPSTATTASPPSRPAPAVPTPAAAPAAAASEAEADETDKKSKKKKRVWKAVVDPRSGKTYYYNRKTRETMWKKPPEMIAEEEELGEAKPA